MSKYNIRVFRDDEGSEILLTEDIINGSSLTDIENSLSMIKDAIMADNEPEIGWDGKAEMEWRNSH